ncbi:hypothetical protein [Streptomyces sp. NPDC056883]|uniref:hypothetical protein n=1 Tax=Streptomyces sp. NPDC056883 TaxID=3345959 RepID=UPI0036C58F42
MPQEIARAFLEGLQKDIYASVGRSAPQIEELLSVDAIEKVVIPLYREAGITDPQRIEQLISEQKDELARGLPTRYEDPLRYAIIKDLASRIQNAVLGLSMHLPSMPVVGTVPTGEVNAITVKVPGSSQYVVLIQDQLFNYALLFSKVVARAFPGGDINSDGFQQFSADTSDIIANLEASPVITQRFRELIVGYLIDGNPGQAPQYILQQPHMGLAESLYDSMELFVMGHEYAHIITGHLDSTDRYATEFGGGEVEVLTRSWAQEYEADGLGLLLMVKAKAEEGFDLSMSFWGADLFFNCADIVERGISVIETGEEGEARLGSHPPPGRRRQMIRAALQRDLGPESEPPIQLADAVDTITKYLWESIKPYLIQLHEHKIKTAENWRQDPPRSKGWRGTVQAKDAWR